MTLGCPFPPPLRIRKMPPCPPGSVSIFFLPPLAGGGGRHFDTVPGLARWRAVGDSRRAPSPSVDLEGAGQVRHPHPPKKGAFFVIPAQQRFQDCPPPPVPRRGATILRSSWRTHSGLTDVARDEDWGRATARSRHARPRGGTGGAVSPAALFWLWGAPQDPSPCRYPLRVSVQTESLLSVSIDYIETVFVFGGGGAGQGPARPGEVKLLSFLWGDVSRFLSSVKTQPMQDAQTLFDFFGSFRGGGKRGGGGGKRDKNRERPTTSTSGRDRFWRSGGGGCLSVLFFFSFWKLFFSFPKSFGWRFS